MRMMVVWACVGRMFQRIIMRLVIDIFCVAGISDITVEPDCGAWLITVIDITGVCIWRVIAT